MRSTTLMLMGLVVLLATGCTYNAAMRNDFYKPAPQIEQKLPVKLGLVVDQATKSQRFDVVQGVYTWHMDFDVYGALGKAMQAELSNLFEDVVIVEGPEASAKTPMLGLVSLDTTSMGMSSAEARLNLTLKDAKTKAVIGKFSRTGNFDPEAMNGTVFTCHMVLFLTLGVTAPITVPCMTNSAGQHALEALEKKLPSLIHTMYSEVSGDSRVVAYATGRPDLLYGGVPGMMPPMAAAPPPKAPAVASDVDKLPESKTPPRKNAYAVVVGIEQYRQKLPRADYAAHDAEVMSDYLTKVMGFQEENIALLLDTHAARTDLVKYVEQWLPNRVEKGDSVFIYFSGHGAPNPKTGEAYMVPYDGDPSYIDTTGYPLKRLYEQLASLPAREVVVMLDSCFSGAGGRSVIAKGMRPMGLSVETPVLAKGKTVVLAASSGDQVSSTYDAKGHGLFTYFVLKGLQGEADQNKDGTVDLREVFDYIRPQVERVARREYNNEQTPQLLGNQDLAMKGVPLVGRTR